MLLALQVTTIYNLLCILFILKIKQPKMVTRKTLQITVMKLSVYTRRRQIQWL